MDFTPLMGWTGIGIVVAYIAGSATSPLYRMERRQKKQWTGQAGYWEKLYNQAIREKNDNDPFAQALSSLPAPLRMVAKPMVESLVNNPDLLVGLVQKYAPSLLQGITKSESASTVLA